MRNTVFNIDSTLTLNSEKNPIIEISRYLNQISSYGDDISKLTEPEKIFLFVDNLETEVNNGGLNQFFYNSSGNYSHETVEALKAIAAFEMAKIVDEAISLWPEKKVPKDKADRRNLLERISDKIDPKLEELDGKYYKYPDSIGDLLIEYVKKNKVNFK
jgi:hypothetical protein